MTAHELAHQLLAGPNHPVQVEVRTNGDAFWSAPGDITITSDGVNCVSLSGCQEDGEDGEDEDEEA